MTGPGSDLRILDHPELLRERLRAAPAGPGVYLMRGADARVLYVGKAAVLRHRLRSYFTAVDAHPQRTRQLVERIADFEVIACLNEREALILENTLIKKYRPRFNVRLKDDKNYLYLKIPQPGAADTMAPGTAREGARVRRAGDAASQRASIFPRPYYTRRLARDGARYFGPYTSAQSLRTTVKSLRGIFPFRTCSDEIFRRGRVCLDYHIKRCAGPCEGRIDPEAYAELLDEVQLFMDGHSSVLADELRDQMSGAAEALDYERAARLRDRLRAIERIRERQKMLQGPRQDRDCVGLVVDGGRGMVALLMIRDGRVSGLETHELEGVLSADPAECLGSFVQQYYASAPFVPRTILLPTAPAEAELLAQFLAEQRGGPVDLRVPRRGALRQLVAQAGETAASALQQRRIVEDFDSERGDAVLEALSESLGLAGPPRRIECYDISNTMGTNSVGSMVVFEDGRPRPAHYRHFGIRTVEGANDFASIQETLRRRLRRYLGSAHRRDDVPLEDPDGSNGGTASVPASRPPTGGDDESFGTLPDLILIDGGRGQLSAACAVLAEAGLGEVPVFGLAKQNEELFAPGSQVPIVLPRDSATLFLIQRVRDEAHRFAITRHRARRGKTALGSRLDVVPGLGPARRRALLKQFGSIEAIRQATVDDLCAVPGVTRPVALRIHELL